MNSSRRANIALWRDPVPFQTPSVIGERDTRLYNAKICLTLITIEATGHREETLSLLRHGLWLGNQVTDDIRQTISLTLIRSYRSLKPLLVFPVSQILISVFQTFLEVAVSKTKVLHFPNPKENFKAAVFSGLPVL